ncbi:TIGR00730 family Rossman fold protein [Aquidulcibacter sp.]|uniref:LOG family protein n=1 Tax=Aquidulcibacter sp. TaxID=2052990 RepID=UPI0025BA29B0|nr:TIGR00730 family Rossman fold protein [Aquidulcibacter sp.]MCA3694188.1 TIGR00730 family Rossman fold protein [Aquidulcibacter sp.]
MKRVCVFCGSSSGASPLFEQDARFLGQALAAADIELVYGGASVGLMGAVANACLKAGGRVIGILPKALEAKEIAHKELTRLHIVDSMHERKAMMADMSDGFIALPGGLGTIEELFEIWTWGQLGYHGKPFAIYNTLAYYDQLLRFLDHAVEAQLVKAVHREMLIVATDATSLLERMNGYSPPSVAKWTDRVLVP